MVTNGLNHYYCQMDFEEERYQFLKDIPEYITTMKIAIVILKLEWKKAY